MKPMASLTRRLKLFTLGALAGILVGYLQGSALIDVLGLIMVSPLGDLAGQAFSLLETAIATYGIWAYIAASALKGLLLFVIVPAESVTPLYVLQTAETPLHVAGIAVVGAAVITSTNFVVYLISRLAGERLVPDKESRIWDFVEWIVVEHGRASMYLLRITPWIGAWAAIPAGVAKLNIRTFFIYSFLGFLTYEGILGFAAYYGLKAGTESIPFITTLMP